MSKYRLIPERLISEKIITETDLVAPAPAAEDYILECHTADYWYRLKGLELTVAEIRRIGLPYSQSLVWRELLIAGGTIEAAMAALNGTVSFNVAGGTHHAGSDWGEGFCLLNDQAIAAAYLLKKNLVRKVMIIDLDVHQGNGTAEIFQDKKNVFTFSMHAASNFPFRKEQSDLDVGLPDGTTDDEYLDLLLRHLNQALNRFKPDFVFYLSGVDVLETDKLGRLMLSSAACMERDRIVFEYCRRMGLPVQVSMGGGYSPEIQHIVLAHCNTFLAAKQVFA